MCWRKWEATSSGDAESGSPMSIFISSMYCWNLYGGCGQWTERYFRHCKAAHTHTLTHTTTTQACANMQHLTNPHILGDKLSIETTHRIISSFSLCENLGEPRKVTLFMNATITCFSPNPDPSLSESGLLVVKYVSANAAKAAPVA